MSRNQIERLPGADGLDVCVSGPKLSLGALPAFFYFALTAEESLTLAPIDGPVRALSNAPIRSYSVTLPEHHPGESHQRPMDRWHSCFLSGEEPFSRFFEQIIATIELFIAQKLILPGKLVFGGLSRGGWIALQCALRSKRISSLLLFAPLLSLDHFFSLRQHRRMIPRHHEEHFSSEAAGGFSEEILQRFAISDKELQRLTELSLQLYIGNRDEKVGTGHSVQLIEQLLAAHDLKGTRTPQVGLVLYPSIGLMGHGTPPKVFEQGAQWVRETLLGGANG